MTPPLRPDLAALADADRLAAVRRILAIGPEAVGIDRLTRLAAGLLGAEYAQISLLAEEQIVASIAGAELSEGERTGPLEDSLCSVTAVSDAPLVVVDARTHPWVRTLGPVTSGMVGAYLGVPLRSTDGFRLGALCVYDRAPRTWGAEAVDILTELASSVVAELELRALMTELGSTAARLELALTAADIGSFDYDLLTGELLWDDRMIALFGYDKATFVPHVDAVLERVLPEDAERVRQAIAEAVDQVGDFAAEYRIRLPDGVTRWIQARGRVLADMVGRPVRMLGTAFDSTSVRESRDRVARVLETMTDAFFSLDPDWRFTYVNGGAERLLLRPRTELVGRVIWDEFPEARGSTFDLEYRRSIASGEQVTFEAAYPPLDSWFEVRAWPGPDGLSVYFRDISTRREVESQREAAYAEREQALLEREKAYAAAEAANTRLALLADATTRLSASLEPAQVLATLAAIVVPRLGEFVVVGLRAETAALLGGNAGGGGSEAIDIVHIAHADESRRQGLQALTAAVRVTGGDPHGLGRVVATGRPEWLPEVPAAVLAAACPDPATLAAVQELHLGAALTVPLSNRGRTLGAMTVAEPVGGEVDRALLADLGARAAVALDNAILFGNERRIGLTLQRSLLPGQISQPRDVEIAVRYLPGMTGAYIGGDWYQAVPVGDAFMLAIGDVMGHGMQSAARMGQLRAIVATLTLEGHSPAELLTRLSHEVDVLLDLQLATLLVALYRPATRRLTVASAGHPPPLLAPPGEPPRYLEVEPGPPLGAAAARHVEVSVELPAASTLVLYTDGLVENRGEDIDVGLERLREALVELRMPPEQVCDHVLRVLGNRGSDDDVALLVMNHGADKG
ncbi:MAG: SpoIIE family protein phosphatase [Actinomycetota bacterium]|nr:SpoIIE family protein phosphatase [Actinomycetota bacterium]